MRLPKVIGINVAKLKLNVVTKLSMDSFIVVPHSEYDHRFLWRMLVDNRIHAHSLHLNGPTMYQSCCTPGSAVSTYSNLPRERYMMVNRNEESKHDDLAGNDHGAQRLRVIVHVVVATIPWGRTQSPTFSDGCSSPLEFTPTLSIARTNYAPIAVTPRQRHFQLFELARGKVHDDESERRKRT